ncbi:CRT10 domain-containing protein [Hirsutella rhossiliensis]|uniref:CRT10 domain-containing protein n=1 Tax=Hirsutella rhossiliensis TaxID=111463 RepID=A0A9P8SFN4_9HYPO|nr:CRT10 domain-containing protein [Hirsutella rhossiliensis]KAH0960931.1 CRT10 domain-containing protein [Hirsutella rhossiliensis]
MESPDTGPGKRPFQPVSVGTCYAQTANDRFGSGASEAVRERERFASYLFPGPDGSVPDWEEPGSDDCDETSIYQLVPTMQRYRNNLTALSQLYNLYLVAYQGNIFVYVPRSVPKQTIPRHPDLRLFPRPSVASRHIGGYQDPSNPHTINHIMVGALGMEEAVVACYDDGDVVAYLTSEIADWINGARHGPRNTVPRPFLHENVGKSAWGLAVHRKSRLIAVSSNRCEVTVFALGLAPSKKGRQEPDSCECCRRDCGHVESHVRQRARNWRIVVTLGRLADNIPNVCFVDDDQGSADMICAIDIRGAIWLADIWKPSQPATRVEPCNCVQLRNSDSWPALSSRLRGWGILALPRSSFLKVDSVEELLGASGKELDPLPNSTLNMESHLQDIPDNPCSQERSATFPEHMPNHFAFGTGVLNAVFVQHLDADGSQHSDSDELSEEAEVIEGVEIDLEVGLDGLAGAADGVSDIAATLVDTVGPGAETPQMTVQQQLSQGLPPQMIPTTGALYLPTNGGDVLIIPPETVQAATTPPPQLTSPFAGASESSAVATQGGRGHRQSQRPGWPPARLDMVYLPHEGLVLPMPRRAFELVQFLRAEPKSNRNRAGELSVLGRLAKRYHVLRLHEKEMELRSLDQGADGTPREFGILCPQAMNMGQGLMNPTTRLLFRATSRLSMVVHVPELSLVVVGSPIGRVLLVTPTRLATPVKKGQGLLQHGFRVDWVLPRRSDERVYRRVVRPLHGMAVGPVQEKGAQGDGEGAGGGGSRPRRYRLMLHYRNHDMLTYEITRAEETGKVCIF